MAVLELERRGAVAIVTLNRPDRRNALSPEMFVRLAQAWDDIAADPDVRAAVLTGAGNAAFCAGGDLVELVPLITGARQPRTDFDRRFVADITGTINRGLLRDTRFHKPLVAAVCGDAFAGGTEIVLSADIRIAADDARFALPEVRRGMIPSGGSLTRLIRQIGWTATMELVLVGEPITAAHAEKIGLINRVVARNQVLDVAVGFAERIALGAPIALMKAKEAIVTGSGCSIDQSFAIEEACQAAVMATEDAREGPLAFAEKRPARFTGR